MNQDKRPLAVAIVGCVYLAIGALGFVYHLVEPFSRHAFQYEDLWIELSELIAFVSGVFVLRGYNWARWLAVAWMGAHVILSAFHSIEQVAIHAVFCILIAWALFRPEAT